MVLYRDDQLIVLNKPHGLPVQGGPGITRHLDGMLDALRSTPARPRLVHRLDRDTSGVLVLARTPGVAAKLAAAFRGRDVREDLLGGGRRAGRCRWRAGSTCRCCAIAGARGERSVAGRARRRGRRSARSPTTARSTTPASKLAWLELAPMTGRTHQLRVHCVALGTPIVGDSKYHEPDQNNGAQRDRRGPVRQAAPARPRARPAASRRAGGWRWRPSCRRI